ncbi:hypothetical protein LX87_01010 [Larkinella arboricola]|uniref:NHL repeat-containing protein n=1 Tax=Larkinella arboricola TaxID=643671 RepID=A0A327X872_LARAB|nr:hypothetical protein [Larkinella arboricola]RAK02889.1 hypothetical protein LX87_01010 [Larkinella arboricola]
MIADVGNHRIRQISPDGIISTIAGNGIAGFSGDGGLPSQASFNQPIAIAVDAQDNIYISDAINERVRKITPAAVPLAVLSVSLINAHTDQQIRELKAGEEINLAGLPTRNLAIRANTNPATVGSVVFQLSGQQSRTHIENTAPYSLSFTIADYLKVENFTLINAVTHQPIQEITDGQVLDLASLASHMFNIRAHINPDTVASVIL